MTFPGLPDTSAVTTGPRARWRYGTRRAGAGSTEPALRRGVRDARRRRRRGPPGPGGPRRAHSPGADRTAAALRFSGRWSRILRSGPSSCSPPWPVPVCRWWHPSLCAFRPALDAAVPAKERGRRPVALGPGRTPGSLQHDHVGRRVEAQLLRSYAARSALICATAARNPGRSRRRLLHAAEKQGRCARRPTPSSSRPECTCRRPMCAVMVWAIRSTSSQSPTRGS